MTFSDLRDSCRSNSIERLPEIDYGMMLSTQSKIRLKAIMKVLSAWYSKADQRDKLRFTTIDIPTTEYEVGVARVAGIKHHFVVIIKYRDNYESFIHIDGIQEERESIKDRSHPIFKIDCLTDILVDNVYIKEEKVVEDGVIDGWR